MIPPLLPISRANLGWLLLAVLLAVMGAYQGGKYIGVRDASVAAEAQRNAERADALQQLTDTMIAMAAQAGALAREDAVRLEKGEKDRRVLAASYRRLKEQVIEYVEAYSPDDVCGLDDRGLQLWTAGNLGTSAASASAPGAAESHGGVRSAAAASVGPIDGPAAESHRSDGDTPPDVLTVPGSE